MWMQVVESIWPWYIAVVGGLGGGLVAFGVIQVSERWGTLWGGVALTSFFLFLLMLYQVG